MRYEEIDLSYLDHNPDNSRKRYTGIEELAENINAYGLLQNLVVREHIDRFVIVAGERRFRALCHLADQGRWQGPVMCLVIEREIETTNLVENFFRKDLPEWELGQRFIELVESGMMQDTIARKLQKRPNYISMLVRIARLLQPRTIQALNRLDRSAPRGIMLARIAEAGDVLDTDAERERAQLDALQAWIKAPRKHAKPQDTELSRARRVHERFRKLKGKQFSIPIEAAPYVAAIVRYLDGKGHRPRFE